jgi:hypothetical protein
VHELHPHDEEKKSLNFLLWTFHITIVFFAYKQLNPSVHINRKEIFSQHHSMLKIIEIYFWTGRVWANLWKIVEWESNCCLDVDRLGIHYYMDRLEFSEMQRLN